MRWQNYLGLSVGYRHFPSLVRWWFKSEAGARLDLTDDQRLALMKKQFSKSSAHEKDVEAMKDDDLLRLMLQTAREHYKQGFDGLLQDGRLICTDFGFRIENCHDVPVRLWYGRLDTFVPSAHGEQIAARLGSRAHLRLVDETHLTLFTDRRGDILEDLVKTMKSQD